LDPTRDSPLRFERQANRCLSCHGGARTRGVPGLLVRSVHPDPTGHPVIAAGSFLSTHSSPLAQRWGGWYVTGTHGPQSHLGNFRLNDAKKPREIDNSRGHNVVDLSDRVDLAHYLTPHSDIVALMVLEHQADGYNLLTKAAFETRALIHRQAPRVPSAPNLAAPLSAEVRQSIERFAEPVVRYLLFCNEAALTAPIVGTSRFKEEFSDRGPRDRRGRTLREFDLSQRLFRYPCSYLVYSPTFTLLPDELRRAILQRIDAVLRSPEPVAGFEHLSDSDRLAIHDILTQTGILESRSAPSPP
jgi:hypothetical protein